MICKVICVCIVILLPGCIGSSQADYQVDLIRRFRHLRPGPHSYASYNGPWIENAFFDFFVSQPGTFSAIQRLYVPICFTDALLKGLKQHVSDALQSLDRQYSYFVVVQLDRGLGSRHPSYPVDVPCDLDIVGFMAGGCSVCTHFRHVVPIPLLKREILNEPVPKMYNVAYQGRVTHGIRSQ